MVARNGNADENRKQEGLTHGERRADAIGLHPNQDAIHKRPAANPTSICCGAYDYGKYGGGVPVGRAALEITTPSTARQRRRCRPDVTDFAPQTEARAERMTSPTKKSRNTERGKCVRNKMPFHRKSFTTTDSRRATAPTGTFTATSGVPRIGNLYFDHGAVLFIGCSMDRRKQVFR